MRDRQLIYVGAVVLAFVVPLLVWWSLHGRIERLQTVVQERQALDQWMQGVAREAAQLRGSRVRNGAGHKVAGKSLLALVDQTAKQAGLRDSLRRIEPDQQNGVRVWFDTVAFDDMVRWLSDLSRTYGVKVDEVNIEKQPQSGIVNARLVLAGKA